MAWKTNSIKLESAQTIFEEFDITPITDDSGKAIAYSATVNGANITEQGLTRLCKRIVNTLAANEERQAS